MDADPKLFKALIKALPDERVDFISEICHNILADTAKLKPALKTELSEHGRIIRSIASKGFKSRTRRQLIIKYSNVVTKLLKESFKRIFHTDK